MGNRRHFFALTGGALAGGAAWAASDAPQSPAAALGAKLEQLAEMPHGWSQVADRLFWKITDRLPELVAAVFILALFFLLQRGVARLLNRVFTRTHVDLGASRVSVKLARYLLIGFGFLVAVRQLGLEVTSLLAGLGIAGLAVGFAAQDTLANLIAGFTILFERPFRIGDTVTLAGVAGEVREIGLRSTRLRTSEFRHATLPNREVISKLILNHSRSPHLRMDVPFRVANTTDLESLRRLLVPAAAAYPLTLPDPAPQVVVTELGDSVVTLALRVFLRDPHRGDPRADLLEVVKRVLQEAGIRVPTPTRIVRLIGDLPGEQPAKDARDAEDAKR